MLHTIVTITLVKKILLTVQICQNVQTQLLSYVQMEHVSVRELIVKDLKFAQLKNLLDAQI